MNHKFFFLKIIFISFFTIISCVRSDFTEIFKQIDDPIPGNNGALTITNATAATVDLNWTLADDNDTSRALLEYSVYLSTSPDISTESDVISKTPLSPGWLPDTTTQTIISLSTGVTYYLNVCVRDTDGFMVLL